MYFLGANVFIQFALDYGLFKDPKTPIMEPCFRTAAPGDPLAEFYEAHDLLEVMMPLPPMFNAVLDRVSWDSDPPSGIVHAARNGPMLSDEENRCYVRVVGMDV